MELKAIIVDDELNARENLNLLLNNYCEEVKVKGLAASVKEAKKLIDENNPDIVFLDINMPEEDGFKLFEMFPDANFYVIFTTAHNEFALKALKKGAADYLEKPLNIEEIKEAVNKVKKLKQKGSSSFDYQLLKQLLSDYRQSQSSDTIAIPTASGFEMIKINEIIHLEADESYTKIILTDNRKFISSMTIARYDEILDKNVFYRVHKSHIINFKDHLKSFNRHEGNIAILSNNIKIPVARRKVTDFINKIKTF